MEKNRPILGLLGCVLVAVLFASCSHSGSNGKDEKIISYRDSGIEAEQKFTQEKAEFEDQLQQRLSESQQLLDALAKSSDEADMVSLKLQQRQLRRRVRDIALADRGEWPELKSELQKRYDILSASVDRALLDSKSAAIKSGEL